MLHTLTWSNTDGQRILTCGKIEPISFPTDIAPAL